MAKAYRYVMVTKFGVFRGDEKDGEIDHDELLDLMRTPLGQYLHSVEVWNGSGWAVA